MSKILILIVAIFSISSAAAGSVSVEVYRADGNTPLELADPCIPHVYRDIMIGTKLVIVVSSDVNQCWGVSPDDGGSLAITEEYWPYGVLSARGPQIGEDWSGSHLPAAGNEAAVYIWEETGVFGFDMYTGSTGIEARDWFIIDYNAMEIGGCEVGFYDHPISWYLPVCYLVFSHVRTRDFNDDGVVNFLDLALFASYWQQTGCGEPEWCGGTDLDANGKVNANDLMLFCNYWLYQTN